MSPAPQIMAFEAAADRALQRVTLRRWLTLAAQTMRWAIGAVVLLIAGQWLGLTGAWLPVVATIGWLAGAAFWAWRKRPGKYEALALWDQARQSSEAFAAAWWYGTLADRTSMQQRHIDAQALMLDKALPSLSKDLPLPLNRWLWVAPVLACIGFVGSLWQHRTIHEAGLTEGMKQAAAVEAKAIADTDWEKKKLQGLTEKEKQEVEKLKQDIKNTASDLQAEGSKSARDVLNSLEKRARDAEKLAQRLGSDADAWASAKLLAELRQHADTADLGDAVANRNAAQAAKAAGDLATQLKPPQATAEFIGRLNESLKDVRKQAETEDRKRVAGSHVIAAGESLEATKVPEAAHEFEQLAAAMQDLARREQSRKELEKLAQQLRDAGSRIAGNQAGGLQQMAAAGQAGAQSQAQGAKTGQQPQEAQTMNQAPMQPPGLMQNAPQTMMQESQASVAGQQQMGMAQSQEGQPQQNTGKPMLIAPIPGKKSDKPPEMLITGKDLPEPKGGQTITLSTPGGPQAGNATAKVDAAPTTPKKAGRDAQVNAAQGTEGQSSSRAVEGGIRQDAAARTAQQTTVDFIKQQEEALDDASLPPARREQVRRYFTELRKRFEASGK